MNVLAPIDNALAAPPSEEYVRKTASEMARVFRESTARMFRHMDGIEEETKRIQEVFRMDETRCAYHFGVSYSYKGNHYGGPRERIADGFKREAWRIIVNRIGIRNAMGVKAREDFDRQLEKDELPEITEENIFRMIFGLVDRAKEFAAAAAKEVFEFLRPHRSEYKTNDVFRVGKRVILRWQVSRGYGKGRFSVSYSREKYLIAIDNLFHLIDGKRTVHDGRTPLIEAINASPDGRGETEYFRFKCFKNQNLHLEFKNLDIVKQINLIGTGEYVLGESDDGPAEGGDLVPQGSAA